MKKGFTLVELLIVIGILSILATVAVVVLNPVQLFAQARDSSRVSDMATLKSALTLYLALVGGTTSLGGCSSTPVAAASEDGTSGAGVLTALPRHVQWAGAIDDGSGWGGGIFSADRSTATTGYSTVNSSTVRTVDGKGWVDVDFTDVPGGSPLSVLPIDPVNTNYSGYFYGYACSSSNKVFELDTKMESTRYASGGTDDVESTDGGNRAHLYEVGTDLYQ